MREPLQLKKGELLIGQRIASRLRLNRYCAKGPARCIRGPRFGTQRINLHRRGHEFEPKARCPVAGSADLCFITTVPIPAVPLHLARCAVPVELGPVPRVGAAGALPSVHCRDRDGTLIEVANAVD